MNPPVQPAPPPPRAGLEIDQPLAESAPLSANRVEALMAYARRVEGRFHQPFPGQCAVCGADRADGEVTCHWEAVANTRRTIFWSFLITAMTLAFRVIYTRFYRVRFVTRHGVCERCASSLGLRQWLGKVTHHVLFALLILSLFAAVPLTVFAVAMVFCAPDLVPKTLLLWLAALVPLGLSVAGFEANRRWTIPGGLRTVGRYPFVLHKFRYEPAQIRLDRDVPEPRPLPAR